MTADRAADELEIRNVLARLAHCADAGATDEYVALTTDDVTWVMPASPHVGLDASERRGRDEIAAGARERVAAGVQGPGSNTMHTVSTTAVHFDEDDVDAAIAVSTFQFWSDTTTAPVLKSVGRYRDTFRRVHGTWLLARREITFG